MLYKRIVKETKKLPTFMYPLNVFAFSPPEVKISVWRDVYKRQAKNHNKFVNSCYGMTNKCNEFE